jgi:hypothetical protein
LTRLFELGAVVSKLDLPTPRPRASAPEAGGVERAWRWSRSVNLRKRLRGALSGGTVRLSIGAPHRAG